MRSPGARCARSAEATNEASALLFSCWLAKDPLLGLYLSQVVREGKLAGDAIRDVARAHASLGLALCGEEATWPALVKPGPQIHTCRAAALAIARILRE